MRLRIEDAKRRLERTEPSVDEISWQVGYEDASFVRRPFKRITGLAPSAYRRRFRIHDFARPYKAAGGSTPLSWSGAASAPLRVFDRRCPAGTSSTQRATRADSSWRRRSKIMSPTESTVDSCPNDGKS